MKLIVLNIRVIQEVEGCHVGVERCEGEARGDPLQPFFYILQIYLTLSASSPSLGGLPFYSQKNQIKSKG